MKGKYFIIPLVVYPFDVMVSIGEEDKILQNRLKRMGVDLEGESLERLPNQEGRCVMFKSNQTLIRLYKKPVSNIDYGYLQHEIFHAVDFILMRVGVKLCYKSCEAYAYLVQYLTTQIYNSL